MKELTKIITDPIGLHARPASLVVKEANAFESDMKIFSNGKEGNLKSIMNIMAMGVKTDEEITIKITGKDEDKAIAAIEKVLVDNNLV